MKIIWLCFDFLRCSLIFFDLFQIDSQFLVSRVTEKESPFDWVAKSQKKERRKNEERKQVISKERKKDEGEEERKQRTRDREDKTKKEREAMQENRDIFNANVWNWLVNLLKFSRFRSSPAITLTNWPSNLLKWLPDSTETTSTLTNWRANLWKRLLFQSRQ